MTVASAAASVVTCEGVPDLLGWRRWAIFSSCRRYRYLLGHVWDERAPRLLWILLNPSTADHAQADPTNIRCERRARRLGYGGLVIANLFAFRSPDPAALRACEDPVGPANDASIRQALREAAAVVVGWGAHGSYRGRDREVAAMVAESGRATRCLGRTGTGAPRHPLYVPYEQDLEVWP